jgi:hypothetical protein
MKRIAFVFLLIVFAALNAFAQSADPSFATASVGSTGGTTIPATFGGLSHGYIQDASYLMGIPPNTNLIYRQLLKNMLFAGQSLVLTMEDDGAQTTAPTADQVNAYGQLYTDMKNAGYTLILYPGIPMCPNSTTLSNAYAATYLVTANLPTAALGGMVVGNEPDSYPSNGCRTSGYTYSNYVTDFTTWTTGIRGLTGGSGVKFMAPQFGGALPFTSFNTTNQASFISGEKTLLNFVGQHWYPLAGNFNPTTCPGFNATIPNLLASSSATSGATAVASFVTTAHTNGLAYRISEMNSAFCSGTLGVSDVFASALWVIDAEFNLANAGVDGVNIFTDINDDYDMFGFNTNPFSIQFIRPEYYGLVLFQEATQNTAKLLTVSSLTTTANLSVWATVDASSVDRVVVINKDLTQSGNVSLTLTGKTHAGTVKILTASSVTSKTGVTYAGQTLDTSTDGTFQGIQTVQTVIPGGSAGNVYTFSIPTGSVALLTVN